MLYMYSDVFVSFRREDSSLRKNFLSHLLREFSRTGIRSCMDEDEDKEKERGRQISPSSLRAISEWRVSVVILSKNYASSACTLDELVKIMGSALNKSMIVVPVFYEVDSSDLLSSSNEDFERHGQLENPDMLQKWRYALRQLTTIKPGFSSLDWEDDSKLVRKITRHVSALLSQSRFHKGLLPGNACGDKSTAKKTSLRRQVSDSDQLRATITEIPKTLVAMDRHMELIHGVLELESTSEIKVIGISGVTGIGKTTLARFIHRELSPVFQDHCFLETSRNNILDHISSTQGSYKTSIVSSLYKKPIPAFQDQGHVSRAKLLSPTGLKRKEPSTSFDLVSDGKKTRFCNQRVLVIVDNVETIEQLDGIMKDVNFLGSGSRVIIIAKDKSLLLACGVENVYEVDCLKYDEALELFSGCAFKKQYPPENFEKLSVCAVRLTGCLPLGLKLLGSFLCGRTKEEWECELQRLESRQDHEAPVELSELSAQGKNCFSFKLFHIPQSIHPL